MPPDPALKCYLQGLNFGTVTALRGNSHRSIVVIRNYKFGPMTAEPCRANDRPLHSPSNLFRPRRNPPPPRLESRLKERAWVEAPGTAPGSEELISTPFIAIAAQGGAANISTMAHFSKRKTKRDKTGGAYGDNLRRGDRAGPRPVWRVKRRARNWHCQNPSIAAISA